MGVALSDPGGILATPLTIIVRKNDQTDVETILNLVRQHEVGCVVVGLPISMNGSVGRQAEKVQVFVEQLRASTQVPIELRDERLSTVSARRLLQAAGKSTRNMEDDAAAAALILQSYLDEQRETTDTEQ